MTEQWTQAARTVLRDLSVAERVRIVSWLAIAVHGLITWWALSGSWFYHDDFMFLERAHDASLSWDLLMTPHDSQLMPVGMLISWTVAQFGPFPWMAVTVSSVLLAVIAAWACARMLRVLFGERPAILIPLCFYVLTPMAIEGWVWWSAALNSLPIHIAFFLAITAVTQWWRDRRPMHLAMALGAVVLGALSGPRGLVIVVPLGLFVLLFCIPAELWKRPFQVVRSLWPFVVPGMIIAGTYLALYRATTPSPVEANGSAPAAELTFNVLVKSWLPALLGGPWRWQEVSPPTTMTDAPVALIVVSAIVFIGFLLWCAFRNWRVTTAALLILLAQLSVTVVALIFGRGLQLGANAGLTSRYLTDTVPVTTLVLGLLLMSMSDTVTRRPSPAFKRPRTDRWPTPLIALVGALFTASSLTSTITHLRSWHSDYVARTWVQNAQTHLTASPVRIADLAVPELVLWPLAYPHNLASHLLSPLGDNLDAVTRGNNLYLLDATGIPRNATISPRAVSVPGPDEDCGYRITDESVPVALDGDDGIFWWMSIGYLASSDGQLELRIDHQEPITVPVLQGLNTYFLSGEGDVHGVRLRTLEPDDLTVCINPVAIGEIEAAP